MRSDDDINFTIFESFFGFIFLFGRTETVQIRNTDRKIFQSFFETSVMLKRQNRGRNQNRDLLSIGCRFESRTNCDFCFSETNVSTNQSVHYAIIFHIIFHILRCFFLIWSIFVNETCF